MSDTRDATIVDLEGRVAQLEQMQDLLLRLLATTNPLTNVLEQFGATDTQRVAVLKFLDELVMRVRGPERDRPSKAYFEMHVGELLPTLRNDRDFQQLFVDTLKVERPAYRELHEYMAARGWLAHADSGPHTNSEATRRVDR
jgi:hypothetical protein